MLDFSITQKRPRCYAEITNQYSQTGFKGSRKTYGLDLRQSVASNTE